MRADCRPADTRVRSDRRLRHCLRRAAADRSSCRRQDLARRRPMRRRRGTRRRRNAGTRAPSCRRLRVGGRVGETRVWPLTVDAAVIDESVDLSRRDRVGPVDLPARRYHRARHAVVADRGPRRHRRAGRHPECARRRVVVAQTTCLACCRAVRRAVIRSSAHCDTAPRWRSKRRAAARFSSSARTQWAMRAFEGRSYDRRIRPAGPVDSAGRLGLVKRRRRRSASLHLTIDERTSQRHGARRGASGCRPARRRPRR